MAKQQVPRVILLIGIPGSGKSTWAARQDGVVLSSDAMRHLLCGDESNQSIHAQVFATLRYLLRQRLRLGQAATLIDATNLTRRDRKPFLDIAKAFGAKAEAVYFSVPLDVAQLRNRKRSRVVPSEAIAAMAAKIQPPTREEGFARITAISE